MAALTDQALAGQTRILRDRVAAGASLDDVLVDAFAVVREAATRVLGQRPYLVQLVCFCLYGVVHAPLGMCVGAFVCICFIGECFL